MTLAGSQAGLPENAGTIQFLNGRQNAPSSLSADRYRRAFVKISEYPGYCRARYACMARHVFHGYIGHSD